MVSQSEQAAIETYYSDYASVMQPIGVAADIASQINQTNQAVSVTVLGHRLAIALFGEQFVAVEDQCPHRGAKLSDGWLKPEQQVMVCPYHGMEFNADGALTSIPAYDAEGLPTPKTSRWCVPKYRIEQKYGLLWVGLTDTAVVPILDIPILNDSAMKPAQWAESTVNAGVGRLVEGTLDTYHLAFVHAATIGNRNDPSGPSAKTTDCDTYVHETFTTLEEATAYSTEKIKVEYAQWSTPNMVYVLREASDERYGLLFALRAVSHDVTVSYRMIYRDFNIDGDDEPYLKLEAEVDEEDRRIIEQIQPPLVSLERGFEMHTTFDKETLAHRNFMKRHGFSFI